MRVGENIHGSKFRAGAEGNQLNSAKTWILQWNGLEQIYVLENPVFKNI